MLTALVVSLTVCAIVAQLLRWRAENRANRDHWGRRVHDDPNWRAWARQGEDDRR
ncbi:MAG: hypothetical protein ABW203_08530 [Novosphingobium sp.]